MTSIEKAINKASELLLKREDENEYHLHEIDRKWVIEAMMDYAEFVLSGMSEKPNNHIEAQLPQQETLYTEEQVRDIVLKFAEESTFLRQGIAIKWVKDYFKQYKQPKKD